MDEMKEKMTEITKKKIKKDIGIEGKKVKKNKKN